MSQSRFQFKINIFLLNKKTMEEEYRVLKSISSHDFFPERELSEIPIGLDFTTYYASTTVGEVCLVFWIRPIKTEKDILISITPKGALKYLLMCYDLSSLSLLKKFLKQNIKSFNKKAEFIILLSKNACQELTQEEKEYIDYIFAFFKIKKYSVEFWESSSDLETFFNKLIKNILSSFISIENIEVRSIFDTCDLVALTQKLGFKPKDDKIVEIYDDLVFTINLKRGVVEVEPTFCQACKLPCSVSKKLCIVVNARGYSNLPLLYNNLRILSILSAIREGTIMDLKGVSSEREDIRYQIEKIVENCKNCEKRKENSNH
ncbi:MAG: hypothetical protein GF308_18250 [Candidatus Heimdallarchaeota archaeon]|nr:hypothetical protein [Candidatus Heimdallarchaeota archaeon]